MGAFGGPYAPFVITGVEEQDEAIPHRYALYQNYPNPFNSQTKIGFDLPESAWVRLSIYNILGQKIRTLVNEKKKIGHHIMFWDGKNGNNQVVGSGVYLFQFQANNYSRTNKAVFLK